MRRVIELSHSYHLSDQANKFNIFSVHRALRLRCSTFQLTTLIMFHSCIKVIFSNSDLKLRTYKDLNEIRLKTRFHNNLKNFFYKYELLKLPSLSINYRIHWGLHILRSFQVSLLCNLISSRSSYIGSVFKSIVGNMIS